MQNNLVLEHAATLRRRLAEEKEYQHIAQGINHGYAYKPAYRSLSILCSECFEDVPNIECVQKILKATHPYFVEYLNNAAHLKHFFEMYVDAISVWYEEKSNDSAS